MKSISLIVFLALFIFVRCDVEDKNNPSPKTSLEEKKFNRILLMTDSRINQKYIDSIHSHLSLNFSFPINVYTIKSVPDNAKSTMHKGRYRADSLLRFLERNFSDTALKVIYLTHYDITCSKKDSKTKKIKEPQSRYIDWGIFGLGSCPGKTCVVSDFRLWARNASEKKYLNRMKNICVHELGHTFGLPHCPLKNCVMNDANETIVTVDESSGEFCSECKKKLEE